MNYLKIVAFTLPVWFVVSLVVYLKFGLDLFLLHTLTYSGCLFGGWMSECLMECGSRFKNTFAGPAFLAGAVPRSIFPIIFLFFSLKFYHYPIDKFSQCAIISAYFAYYPLMLYVCTSLALEWIRKHSDGKDSNTGEHH